MVLLLKHWKSRSSPGIVAGACARDHKNPFTLLLASGAGSHIRGLGYRANMAQRPASLAEAEPPLPDPATMVDAGWSNPVARQANKLKGAGSNPAPATNARSEEHTAEIPAPMRHTYAGLSLK